MKSLLYLLLLTLLVVSCKRTESGEKNRWQTNQNMIQGLAAKYPAFRNVLEARLAEASQLMDKANAVSGEEERIEAMSDANRSLNVQFINELKKVDDKITTIRDLGRDALKMADNRTEKMLADVASRNADQSIDSARDLLTAPPVADEFEAIRRVDKAMSLLSDAEETLKKAISEMSVPEETSPADTARVVQ